MSNLKRTVCFQLLVGAAVLAASARSATATNFELFNVLRMHAGHATLLTCPSGHGDCFSVIIVVVIRTLSGSEASMSPTFVFDPSASDPLAEVDRDFGVYASAAKAAIADSLTSSSSSFSADAGAVANAFARKLNSLLHYRANAGVALTLADQIVVAAIARKVPSTPELVIAAASAGSVDVDVSGWSAADVGAVRDEANSIPGVSAPTAVGGPTLQIKIAPVHLTMWVQAFIPRDLPTVSVSLAAGSHAGETAVQLPTTDRCFLTDQRSFSSDFNESRYRIRAQVDIDLTLSLFSFKALTEPTVEVDCATGSTTCTKQANNDGILASAITTEIPANPGRRYSFTLTGGASNPCVGIAPRIEWKLPFVVLFTAADRMTRVALDGFVQAFPAFEAYAGLDAGTPQALFQRSPAPGVGPTALVLPPTTVVQVVGQEIH
jgi:hypothetical protein